MYPPVDPAARGRTYESGGAQFMCATGSGGGGSQCDIKHFVQPRAAGFIARDLLEETGAWYQAIKALGEHHPIPAGVVESVTAAYQATLAWVERLDTNPATAHLELLAGGTSDPEQPRTKEDQ